MFTMLSDRLLIHMRFLRRLSSHAYDPALHCVKYATKAIYLCYGRDDPTLFVHRVDRVQKK